MFFKYFCGNISLTQWPSDTNTTIITLYKYTIWENFQKNLLFANLRPIML